jgi:hypothetical protein
MNVLLVSASGIFFEPLDPLSDSSSKPFPSNQHLRTQAVHCFFACYTKPALGPECAQIIPATATGTAQNPSFFAHYLAEVAILLQIIIPPPSVSIPFLFFYVNNGLNLVRGRMRGAEDDGKIIWRNKGSTGTETAFAVLSRSSGRMKIPY